MREFWKLMKNYVAPYWGYLCGSVLVNMLSAVFNIFSFSLIIPILQILFKLDTAVYEFIPWNSGGSFKEILLNNVYYYVTTFIDQYGASMTLLFLCLSFAVMTALKTSCYFGASAIMVPLRTGVVRDIRTKVYNKVLGLPLGFFSQERKGDIIARMSGDVTEIETSIAASLDLLIKDPILIVFYFATLIFVSWKLTLFTVLVVPLLAWVMGWIGRKLKRQSLETQARWSDTMSQLDETLGGLRVIKAFVAEDRMKGRFLDTSNALRRSSAKVATRQALAHPMSEFLGTIMIMIVLWFGGTLILGEHSTIDAPTFIFFLVILYSVLPPLKEFSKTAYMIPKGMASMERVNKILYAESDIVEKPDALDISDFSDSIELRDVRFSYANSKEVLHNVSISVKKGQTVALVGQSGSGKSTLVDLIPRYHDVKSGAVTIDGTDVRDMKLRSLRGMIGNVNQEAILFNDTIFNNIAFGVENATMESVVAAAKIANAHDFIMEKEKGYDTMVGDRGGLLSGGQRQRISIARAILKNPPILILDEATSALDTESERLVQEALDRLTSTRTTVAIAHRLSTIKNADVIYVLHDGRIVEHGRHEELIALNGYYKKLNDMQAL